MSQAVLRIVKAPNLWHCQAGHLIQPSEQCAKIGKVILCISCLLRALPPRPERKLTKDQRLLNEAQFLALDNIADLTHFAEGDQLLLLQCLETDMAQVQNELGLRSMPYHGRAHNLFPEVNSHQLDAMLKLYQKFHSELAEVTNDGQN
jgi:hypothetical protein